MEDTWWFWTMWRSWWGLGFLHFVSVDPSTGYDCTQDCDNKRMRSHKRLNNYQLLFLFLGLSLKNRWTQIQLLDWTCGARTWGALELGGWNWLQFNPSVRRAQNKCFRREVITVCDTVYVTSPPSPVCVQFLGQRSAGWLGLQRERRGLRTDTCFC